MLNKSTDPQCLPITSRMKVLWWLRVRDTVTLQLLNDAPSLSSYVSVAGLDLCAVVVMASTTSMMRCRAESVPMVMSVPQKSLSMEPTMPTMFRWEDFFASCSVILPAEAEISDIRGSKHHRSSSENQSFNPAVDLLWSRDYPLAQAQPAARSTPS